MSNRQRGTVATQRATASGPPQQLATQGQSDQGITAGGDTAAAAPEAPAALSYIPDAVVEFLTEAGWTPDGDDRPSTASWWSHDTKADGLPLRTEDAYRAEREAQNAAEGQRLLEEARPSLETAAAPPQSVQQTQDELRQIIADAEAELAATREPEPDAEFAHDRLGAVTIFRCYRCNHETRYCATCDCEACGMIAGAIACPNCGDTQPNVEPGRR